VDGASLTVVNCDQNTFTVALIPYTRDNTVLGHKEVGSSVNIETDIIGKYIEQLSIGNKASIDLN
jgi:riboflavin synthase